MSLTGQPEICLRNQFPQSDPSTHLTRPAAVSRWISRNRAVIEAAATLSLAMTAPVLGAVATLQTSLTA
jgi:hypothetical protein